MLLEFLLLQWVHNIQIPPKKKKKKKKKRDYEAERNYENTLNDSDLTETVILHQPNLMGLQAVFLINTNRFIITAQ